jgi:hypothetical protein
MWQNSPEMWHRACQASQRRADAQRAEPEANRHELALAVALGVSSVGTLLWGLGVFG